MNNTERPAATSKLQYGFEPAWIAAEARARGAYAVLIPHSAAQVHTMLSLADSPHVLIASGATAADRELSRLGISHQHVPATGLSVEQVNQYIVTTFIAGAVLSLADRVLIGNYTSAHQLPTHLVDSGAADLSVLPLSNSDEMSRQGIQPRTVLSVLNLALEMGSDRTGRTGGTMFIMGNHQELSRHCEPFLFEPFHSYPRSQRSILDSQLRSTIIKFARLDGAFIISGNGVVEQLVRKVNPPKVSPLIDPGLGSRHATACSITLVRGTVAVTVSESAGNVSLFGNGALTYRFTPRGRS